MFLTDKQLVVRDHISEHYPCSRKEIVEVT